MFSRKFPIPGLGRELDEGLMQDIACDLNHFRIIVIANAQKDRHVEIGRPLIDLKRDANLRIRLPAIRQLDARDAHLRPRLV